jgi:Mce-associated membrane protein
MPDRPRNRPRIAGQRRTPEQVTPATLELPEEAVEEVVTPEVTTDSDQSVQSEEVEEVVEPAAGRPNRLNVVLTVSLSVLIVIVLALAGFLGLKAWRGQEAEDARNEAATAGRKAAETALSYDYRSLDKSFADARATMTPEFAAKFDETAKVAGELATKTQATVRAEVREVGVRDGDANRVTLVIFVNQTTTSTITQGKPRVDLNRTRFTMVRNGGQWLVQEIAGL